MTFRLRIFLGFVLFFALSTVTAFIREAFSQPAMPSSPSMVIPWENTLAILAAVIGYGIVAIRRRGKNN